MYYNSKVCSGRYILTNLQKQGCKTLTLFLTFQALTLGEMSGNVLMDISVMADEVIGPLLCNPENQKGWPKIVATDMKRHVNELRSLMHQVNISYLHNFVLLISNLFQNYLIKHLSS